MTVYLVGAGPGDPGLLTRRGAELLGRADVVVYDRLASAALLALAPSRAEFVDVGKAPGRAAMSQEDINDLLVARASDGKEVVRLKGGDPFVFGRGGEEAEACIMAGVEFEVVPGITSAIAAPAYAGIPVTHRGVSTSVTIVTGHEDPDKPSRATDWAALARAGNTLVILMGAGHLAEIADALLAGGCAPATPVAAVRWGTRPEQRTIRATLATIAGAGVEAPSAIVVGDVAALDFGWFERRPLIGKRIVVTRAREQSSALRAELEALGADVIELPTIAIEPLAFDVPDLRVYEWAIFTSANGVDAFFERGLGPRGADARALAQVRVAAIGSGTADALSQRGIIADLIPEKFVAESLLEAVPAPSTPRARVLLARAQTARDVLPEGLRAKGYAVDVLAVYRTVAVTPAIEVLDRVRAGAIDAITFTSASTVTNFCAAVGSRPDPPPLVVSIGPVTSAAAKEHGFEVAAVAEPPTIEGLVSALRRVLGRA
ncbi:MAG: uroporphyrinogen-III C-methyltransferase [Actinomycetota bacterium]